MAAAAIPRQESRLDWLDWVDTIESLLDDPAALSVVSRNNISSPAESLRNILQQVAFPFFSELKPQVDVIQAELRSVGLDFPAAPSSIANPV
jgi:hypothetical protein